MHFGIITDCQYCNLKRNFLFSWILSTKFEAIGNLQIRKEKFKNSFWKWRNHHFFLLSMYKVGMRLICIYATIFNRVLQNQNITIWLSMFYLSEELQNSDLPFFVRIRFRMMQTSIVAAIFKSRCLKMAAARKKK